MGWWMLILDPIPSVGSTEKGYGMLDQFLTWQQEIIIIVGEEQVWIVSFPYFFFFYE